MLKQILSQQPKFKKSYLLATSFESEKLLQEKILIFVEIFFQEYIDLGLKIFSVISEGFFEWQKQNIAIVTFKQALYYMQLNNTYII